VIRNNFSLVWFSDDKRNVIKAIIDRNLVYQGCFVRQLKEVNSLDVAYLPSVITELKVLKYIDEIIINKKIYLRLLRPYEEFDLEEKEFYCGNKSKKRKK